jgi:hypothetical protein
LGRLAHLVKIEVLHELLHGLGDLLRVHADETILEHLLTEVNQNLPLVQGQLLVEGVVLVVKVQQVLEVLPEGWVYLVLVAEVKLVSLALHHLAESFLFRACAFAVLRSVRVARLLRLVIHDFTRLVESVLRLLFYEVLQVNQVQELLNFELVLMVLQLLAGFDIA